MESLPLGLQPYLLGAARVERDLPSGAIRLILPPTSDGYADAQLDDYQGLSRARFRWKPPLRLTLEARASHADPLGTLGFGFWNDPFAFSIGLAGGARRFPAMPQALWFFYGSPPNDLRFASGLPGNGWMAASLRSPRVPPLLVAPLAAGAGLLSLMPGIRALSVAAVRAAITQEQRSLSAELPEWHRYSIEWQEGKIAFSLDGQAVLNVRWAPRGPLGFVAWIDNQYAAISRRHGIRFGTLPTSEVQWLEMRNFELEPVSLV